MSNAIALPSEVTTALRQLVNSTEQQRIAILAAAIIGKSEHSWSVADTLELCTTLNHALHPIAGNGGYLAWSANKDQHLAKVWK